MFRVVLGFYYFWSQWNIQFVHVLEWQPYFIVNLPGVIALIADIAMWMTSINYVQNNYNFELFFYTHQLYIIFVLFLAFHVGDFIFNTTFIGLFLLTFDQFYNSVSHEDAWASFPPCCCLRDHMNWWLQNHKVNTT